DRERLRSILGTEHLYTDVNVLAVTAVLAHPSHAVLWEGAEHPGGLALDWDGKFPEVERIRLPAGVYYLTLDPAGRSPLWQRGRMSLVRW
ncbi:MAG: hypothetical protein ACE5F1_19000, partial [Planctomycetota bacterium]